MAATEDPLVVVVRETEERRVNGLMAYAAVGSRGGTTGGINEEHRVGVLNMAMHGKFFVQQAEVPAVIPELCHDWLNTSHLRFETEACLCAAQEQALATRYIKAKIWKEGGSSICRLCKAHDETVHHIISGCSILAATKYKHRHNQIGACLHWLILKKLDIKVSDSWLRHKPDSSTIKGKMTLMWDMPIITGKNVGANRPDIVIHDSEARTCSLIDMAVPIDRNVNKKVAEKILKYKDLAIELKNVGDSQAYEHYLSH